MPRPKKTVRTVFKHIGIPEDLAGKMEVFLYSELEGKIPLGAQQEFFTMLMRDFFTKEAGMTKRRMKAEAAIDLGAIGA